MNANTKSLLKNTIMGLVGGGTLAALYSLNKAKKDDAENSESDRNEIVVPLSRKNFMRSVKSTPVSEKSESKGSSDKKADVSKMTPQELQSYKKSLLKKKGEAQLPTAIAEKTGPATSTSSVRRSKKANYATLRNEKGQFSTEHDLAKKAGIRDDANGLIMDAAGATGGFFTGMTAVKYLADRIIRNRKRKQLETSRRKYVDMLAKEVNDEDAPYYRKSASDRGTLGSLLGWAGLAGITTAGIAGTVVYRIMENRRKEAEKDMDKDLSKYPEDKTIKFKFASARGDKENRRFFV